MSEIVGRVVFNDGGLEKAAKIGAAFIDYRERVTDLETCLILIRTMLFENPSCHCLQCNSHREIKELIEKELKAE